jgi:hypothetical protein
MGQQMDLKTAIDYIENDKQTKTAIYISIGSALNMTKIIKNNGKEQHIIDDKYNQQYPICMKKIRSENRDVATYLILIDPFLESPPFIVRKNIGIDHNKLDDKWYQDVTFSNIYCHKSQNLKVIAINKLALYNYDAYTYSDDDRKNNTEMTEDTLFNFNNMCIKNNWFLLVHDFTGRSTSYLADYFSEDIKNHTDHIIYGLGNSNDNECYIDLTEPLYNLVYYNDPNNESIKAFNPIYYHKDIYKYGTEYTIKMILSKKNKYYDIDGIIMKEQIDNYKEGNKNKLKTLLGVLRRTFLYMSSVAKMKVIDISKGEISHLFGKDSKYVQKLLDQQNYQELYELCEIKIRKCLTNILNNDKDMSDNVYNDIIGNKDPYQWIATLNNYVL